MVQEDLRAVRYQRRTVDAELDALVDDGVVALSLEGAKAVGKTATAAERVEVAFPLEQASSRELLDADPSRLLQASSVLVDEWQQLPVLWDVIRRAVDHGGTPGQFLLTGSASAHRPGTHSGAGRIVSIRMRPMTLPERDVDAPSVSLASLLTGDRPAVGGETGVTLERYAHEIAQSGFPAIRTSGERARRAQLDGYITRIIDHDVPDVSGRSVRNPAALRRWITAYAAATATCASFEKIRDAATSGEGHKPAKTTVQPYRDALENLYVVDPLPAWQPTRSHIAELAHAPKHHLADPALAVATLGLDVAALLDSTSGGARTQGDGAFLGALFESLATLQLRVLAQASEARCGHLRTHRGDHEIDLIVERRDGRILAAEVKLSARIDDSDIEHLAWLRERIGGQLLDSLVITSGPYAYRREDGIAVVPLALFGP